MRQLLNFDVDRMALVPTNTTNSVVSIVHYAERTAVQRRNQVFSSRLLHATCRPVLVAQ